MRNPSIRSLADYLEASAARFPDRPAVVGPDGRTLTYSELDANADRIAGYLAKLGVQPGDRVALLLPKSVETVATIWGILKARAVYVPIDWNSPAGRAQSIMTDCNTRAVFVDAAVTATVNGCDPTPKNVIVVGAKPDAPPLPAGWSPWSAVFDVDLPAVSRDGRAPDQLAYILYTSGSTGKPKGVMLSHENALSFVDWCSGEFHPNQHDRFSSHAPFHFDLSVLDLYVSIKHGASVHLIDDATGKNPKMLTAFAAERELTVWYSTPSILHLMASLGNLDQGSYPNLRLVLFAGEVFPVKHLRELTRIWSKPVYYNLYGPTETNVCTFARIPSTIPEDRTEPYPIGWACSHCHPLVLDTERQRVAAGGEGLLYIQGESVFQGYWNRPAEQNAAFIEFEGSRWYCTGDVVVEDPEHGFIYVGRRDRMVKRRGYRIELDEIEKGLYPHPRIREVAVVAVINEGDVKIVAYLAPSEQPGPGILEMKMFCGKQLPSYMNPDVFSLVTHLPRTSTDKVDYQTLVKWAAEPRAIAAL